MSPKVRHPLVSLILAPTQLMMALRLKSCRIKFQISINQLRQITKIANMDSVIFPKEWKMRTMRQAVYKYVVTLFKLEGDISVPLKKSVHIDCQPEVISVINVYKIIISCNYI